MAEEQHIKFLLKEAKDYRTVPANGVWLGVTPRGDVKMDFFVESQSVPKVVVHDTLPTGEIGKEIGREPDARVSRTFDRELTVTVVMDRNQAKIFAEFLTKQINDFEKLVAGSGEQVVAEAEKVVKE